MKRLLCGLAMMMLTACSTGPSEVPGERGCSFEPMLDGVVVAFESGDGGTRTSALSRPIAMVGSRARREGPAWHHREPRTGARRAPPFGPTATHVNEVEEGCLTRTSRPTPMAGQSSPSRKPRGRERASVPRRRGRAPDELTRAFDVASAFFAEAARLPTALRDRCLTSLACPGRLQGRWAGLADRRCTPRLNPMGLLRSRKSGVVLFSKQVL